MNSKLTMEKIPVGPRRCCCCCCSAIIYAKWLGLWCLAPGWHSTSHRRFIHLNAIPFGYGGVDKLEVGLTGEWLGVRFCTNFLKEFTWMHKEGGAKRNSSFIFSSLFFRCISMLTFGSHLIKCTWNQGIFSYLRPQAELKVIRWQANGTLGVCVYSILLISALPCMYVEPSISLGKEFMTSL